MEKYIYKGKEEKVVLESALKELNIPESEILIKTKEEKGGLFSGKKVVIEIVKIEDISEFGKTILENILKGFNIKGNIEKQIRDKQISYKVYSDNNGILIGKNGKTLESIQKYLKQSISAQTGMYVNIILDKEKQNYFLERDVKKIARQVTLSKIDVKLDPMNSFQRRIVHNALSKFDYITTESVGVEPNRCVVIKYKEKSN